MKRNRLDRRTSILATLLLFLLFLSAAVFIFPSGFREKSAGKKDELSLTCTPGYRSRDISIRVHDDTIPEKRLREALEKGHSAEIHYRVRLLERRKGAFSLLGDSLIEEWNRVYSGMWNPVINRYSFTRTDDISQKGERLQNGEVSPGGGAVRAGKASQSGEPPGTGDSLSFDTYSSFIDAFTMTNLKLSLPDAASRPQEGRYLRAKVILIPEVPVPPFNLLAPFLGSLRISSPWKEVEWK